MTTKRKFEVTSKDLPLACPTQEMHLWNAHPKVYLAIEKTGKASCPYCSAVFVMTDFDQFKKKSKGH